MLRFVIGPDDEVVPDLDARLPGRGIWLSPSRDVVKAAVKRNAFAKSVRGRAVVSDDLPDRVEALLVKRCIEGVALARRANQAVAGFEKVKAWLVGGKAALVLAACDGAQDGRGKISNLARGICVCAGLTSQELAIPFARGTTVHVAIAPGGLADRLKRDLARLEGLRLPRHPRLEKAPGGSAVPAPGMES